MARSQIGFGYELEIDHAGQMYLASGDERFPILMDGLVVRSDKIGGLMQMEIEANFITTGGPERRQTNAPIIVIPTNATRRLRLREGHDGKHARAGS